jgi:hypothetical protein
MGICPRNHLERVGFAAGLIRQNASPQFKFDPATYLRTAASFDDPDNVAIVIDNYSWRRSLLQGESRYDDLE